MTDGPNYFPHSKQEALALEYVKAQDLSGKTPEQLAAMYDDAFNKICQKFKSMVAESHAERRTRQLDY